MLVALEIKPSPIVFPTSASQPQLDYDLAANPPQDACKDCQTLTVWQLEEPPIGQNPWRWVADASRVSVSNRAYARAKVNHFSVFALVALPPAAPILAANGTALVVESDFLAERETSIKVQLTYLEGPMDTARSLEKGSSRLFRFSDVHDPQGLDDPACPGTPAESLTCLFPLGTDISLDVAGDGNVVITRSTDQYRVEFAATVEIL
jgi:hypothetical protein